MTATMTMKLRTRSKPPSPKAISPPSRVQKGKKPARLQLSPPVARKVLGELKVSVSALGAAGSDTVSPPRTSNSPHNASPTPRASPSPATKSFACFTPPKSFQQATDSDPSTLRGSLGQFHEDEEMNDKENERPERTEAEVRQTALIQDIRTFFKDRNAEGIVSSWTDASIPKIVSKIYLGSQDTPELRKAQELAAFILERHPDCRQFAQQLTGYVTSQTSARSQTRSPPNRSQTRSPLRRPLRTRTPTPSSHSSRIQKRAITPSKHSSLRLRKFKLEDLSITEEEAPDYRRLLIHSVVRGGLVQDEFFLRQKVHQQWSETERCLAVEALMLQARATDLVLRVLFL